MGEAKRKMEQAMINVRLNLILAHLQHKGAWPDLKEIDTLAKYVVTGQQGAITPVHGIIQG